MSSALLLLTALSSITAWAQYPDDTNARCVKRLEMPSYPALAKTAQVTGTVIATVTLNAEAKAQKVETSFSSRPMALFGQSLNVAFKKSDFRKECAGKTVRLIFHFEIAGTPSDNLKVTIAYGYPNEFWVVTEPPIPMIN